ncbi:MAG: efflux RND transporter periplasmic adaptor subunit [Mesorhizobium sp.]|uniref:efflux RND transporter periplasmic adaptor subunit n=1 Tax=Mesorhizobium sp. TaxID=1871066 RepID=UPI000FE41F9A|nr:efflux RND transporter periplasmic adaptor subunit [Mesorhizobium sp.]RWA99486.1 MAG: efflux RND transporter periplasmic adaptor subunit [Mesorhizobium sp.]RWC04731.1 MAG: efflux RND transporter periplasmic adaptor subunit [Mesorhizobium sp.]RWO06636.1 MAG: efflux RND transporter periplasmic adaptor subunit [Mesorhizobium sp.]RWP02301.1 MAG: efflux RND transporter periplasmic adaptor subunit [Mesorhizobium sp.]RWP13799.1 MAG: efflux RND transporter periplasmic adaptor subunit [Mesorhizobium
MFVIKRFIIAFILLVLVCGGIVGFNLFRDNAMQQFFATMKPPAATVSTTIVKPTEWTPGVEAIGTVSAVRGVDLTVETAGIVKDILFHANQKVEANASLLQLDDAAERADLDATKAQAALDQTALTRALELQKRDVGSESTLDTARAAALASASRVNRLQAVLKQKLLTAPFGGTVGIPRIDLGQYLSPGTSVATLQDLETMRADFSVPEQQLPLLKIGQTVRLGIGDGELPFAGTIRGIDPKIDPTSRLVTVRAEVANPEGKLTPGQFVQVRVELPEENNVLTVPQTALTSSLYGDFVFVVRPAKPAAANGAAPAAAANAEEKPTTDSAKPATEAPAAKPEEQSTAAPAEPTAEEQKPQLVLAQVFVKPGRRNAGLVEILEGIAPGDEVVTAGQNRLSNGMSVAVDNTVDPTKPANQQAAQK